jgi:hypothetical protein
MKTIGNFLAVMVTICSLTAVCHALTIDEIIKLKGAGVSDSTIELLIQRSGDARSAGIWKQDGWIIHSTESRFPDLPIIEAYQDGYPVDVYPQFSGDSFRGMRDRHHRLR